MTLREKSDNKSLWLRFLTSSPTMGDFPSLQIIGSEIICNPSYRWSGAERRDHTHNIIQYTLKGKGVFVKDGKPHEVVEGQGFVCYSHDPSVSYFYPATATEPWQVLFVDFQGGNRFVEDIVEQGGHIFEFDENSEFFSQLKNFHLREGDEKELSFTENSALMAGVLSEIAATRAVFDEYTESSHLVKKAVRFINNRLETGCLVAEVAADLGISKEHFFRRFKKETGQGPSIFIREKRMEHAVRLLNSSFLSIKEIATRMNFDTVSNFSRSFRQVYNCSPGAYRRSH